MLRVYAHNSIKSATDFVDEVRCRLPMAIQRIQTDHGSEFGTDFTWHLRDLGMTHRQIPRGCPQANGKVERSHRTEEDEFYRRVIFRNAELAQRRRAPVRASDRIRTCSTIGLNITELVQPAPGDALVRCSAWISILRCAA